MHSENDNSKHSPLRGKSSNSMANVTKFVKNFDIYQKVAEDYKVQTSWGAALSLVGWFIIFILVLAELHNHFSIKTSEKMIVDTSLGTRLRINVNITYHALTCAEVHLDAMDVAGDNQLNMEADMMKQRLSPMGLPIGVPGIEIIGEKEEEQEPLPADYCGPCYGAETQDIKCCNTCEDLKSMYLRKGWGLTNILKDSVQCLRDKTNPFSSVRPGEGCRVSGTMNVNKVAGNFHVAHGESIIKDGHHIHQFNVAEAPKFNISHTIHSISFGDPYPDMPPNPLDSVSRIVDIQIGTGLFQYFIKVIPTIYTNEYSEQLFTNQYTFTERFRPLAVPNPDGTPNMQGAGVVLPGMFFVYDIAPFLVEIKRITVPTSHLLTRLCAIVGGVFSVMGVVDALCFRLQKMRSAVM